MPGLEIRYLGLQHQRPVGEGQGRPAGHGRGRRPRPHRGQGVRLHRRAALLAHPVEHRRRTPTPSTTSTASRAARRPRRLLRDAGITTPVKLKLHYTTDHYGAGTAKEFEALKKQLNATKLFDVTVEGTEWSKFRPAQKRGDYAVYGMGWFPDFPDPDNYIAPVPGQGQLPQHPVREHRGAATSSRSRGAPPTAPPRPRPSRRSRRSSPTTCRCCRCGRASSTSPPATASPASSGCSTPARTCSCGSWDAAPR